MIKNCKFCEKEIPTPKLGEDYWCIHCQKYSVVYMENGYPESETLRVGNYHLCFLPAYREASVVETKDGNKRILHSIKMDEFTHELALHWANKLKTYVLFQ